MPTSNGLRTGWRVATAASTGSHHIATGLTYEDAVDVRPATSRDKDTSTVAVAVADGHGHARHFRSARGSELAVQIATELGAKLAKEIGRLSDPEAVDLALRTKTGPDVVRQWRRAVEQDLKKNPVSAAELVAAGLTPQATIDELVYGYGTTLIAAVTAGPWLLCLQIGDGDLFVVTDAGTVLRPLPADPRLDGSRTTSICQVDAVDSMRYAVVPVSDKSIGAVMLATDGYGNAQVRNDWEIAFGSDLAALLAQHGSAWIAEQLPKWVAKCASSEGSGDDVTVALLFAMGTEWKDGKRSSALPAADAAATVVSPAEATLSATTVPDVMSAPLPSTGQHPLVIPDDPTIRVDPAESTRPAPAPAGAPSAGAPRARPARAQAADDPTVRVAEATTTRTEPTLPAAPVPQKASAAHSKATPSAAAAPAPSAPAPAGDRHRGLVITLSVLVAIAAIALAVLIFLAAN